MTSTRYSPIIMILPIQHPSLLHSLLSLATSAIAEYAQLDIGETAEGMYYLKDVIKAVQSGARAHRSLCSMVSWAGQGSSTGSGGSRGPSAYDGRSKLVLFRSARTGWPSGHWANQRRTWEQQTFELAESPGLECFICCYWRRQIAFLFDGDARRFFGSLRR